MTIITMPHQIASTMVDWMEECFDIADAFHMAGGLEHAKQWEKSGQEIRAEIEKVVNYIIKENKKSRKGKE